MANYARSGKKMSFVASGSYPACEHKKRVMIIRKCLMFAILIALWLSFFVMLPRLSLQRASWLTKQFTALRQKAITRPQLDTDQTSGLFHDNPRRSICYREDHVIGLDLIFSNISLEPVSYFLREKNHLSLFAAFGVPDDYLPIFDISGNQFQNFPDSHAASCHELRNEPVSLP